MEQFDVAIVGSGPCGVSIAARLAQRSPALLERTIVLEKGRHPRPKVCGGAITLPGVRLLKQLGFRLDFPHVPIERCRIRFEGHEVQEHFPGMGIVTHRNELDQSLMEQARARGMRIQEECAVADMKRVDGHVEIETSQGHIRARAVVGADGSSSTVRRAIGFRDTAHVCRLLKVLTPENPDSEPAFARRELLFDFSQVPSGLQGYYWEFPSFVDGKPVMNRGVLDARICSDREHSDLKGSLRRSMADSGRTLDDAELSAAPVRWFNGKAPISVPHTLLAGDAAGIEPLFAEGLSFAFEYGRVTGEYLARAFERDDLSFADWGQHVRRSALGMHLRARAAVARSLYGVRTPLPLRITWLILQRLWPTISWVLFKRRHDRALADA